MFSFHDVTIDNVIKFFFLFIFYGVISAHNVSCCLFVNMHYIICSTIAFHLDG